MLLRLEQRANLWPGQGESCQETGVRLGKTGQIWESSEEGGVRKTRGCILRTRTPVFMEAVVVIVKAGKL